MKGRYRVVSDEDGYWKPQYCRLGFWWVDVGQEVNDGVWLITRFETAAEARDWIQRREWEHDPVAYRRGYLDGLAASSPKNGSARTGGGA